MDLEIVEPKDGGDLYYVFEDLADELAPDAGNHTVEERVIARLLEKGCTTTSENFTSPVMACTGYVTPRGVVGFDSESGMFECHSPDRGPVEYVVEVIRELAGTGTM